MATFPGFSFPLSGLEVTTWDPDDFEFRLPCRWVLGGSFSKLGLLSVVVLEKGKIRVTFQGRAAATGSAPNGPLNANTWRITHDDGDRIFVALVTEISDNPFTAQTVLDLLLVTPLGNGSEVHTVATTMVEDDGDPADPISLTFLGITSTAKPPASRENERIDLFNSPFPVNPFGGTLAIGSDGDYIRVSGADLDRKLIYRRLSTRPGSFKHLPDYGLGIGEQEPVALGTASPEAFKQEIRRQILQEPTIQDAQVRLSINPREGILTVQLRAQRNTNETFSENMTFGGDLG